MFPCGVTGSLVVSQTLIQDPFLPLDSSRDTWDGSIPPPPNRTESGAVADLRGARPPRPPMAQNFFIFMQFSGKIGQIIGWRPPLGLAPPPLGNPGSATEKGCGTWQYACCVHTRGLSCYCGFLLGQSWA